jgi:hypothetical protein
MVRINKIVYLVDFLQSPPAEQISAGASEYVKIAVAMPAQYLSTPSEQAWGVASTSQTKVLRMMISLAISSGVIRYAPNLATPALQVSQSTLSKKMYWYNKLFCLIKFFFLIFTSNVFFRPNKFKEVA